MALGNITEIIKKTFENLHNLSFNCFAFHKKLQQQNIKKRKQKLEKLRALKGLSVSFFLLNNIIFMTLPIKQMCLFFVRVFKNCTNSFIREFMFELVNFC